VTHNNVSSFSIYFESANSISGDDIKLTERLFVPSRKLRGFERGKVGPKDGADFIGGNYITAFNASTTLPVLFENSELLDATLFLDIANIWGVDYDSSIDDSNKIRSAIGIGVDWFTAIGPVNFSLTESISKADTDITESFRFNIGTTF
jgi:outer membrane protein insertion porin family